MATVEERMAKGLAKRRELWGNVQPTLSDDEFTSQLMDLVNEVLFGEIWCRPALTVQQREIACLAALTALGKENQLRAHVRSSLNVGLTKGQIGEVLIQMAFYAGLPAALNALAVAHGVFKEAEQKSA